MVQLYTKKMKARKCSKAEWEKDKDFLLNGSLLRLNEMCSVCSFRHGTLTMIMVCCYRWYGCNRERHKTMGNFSAPHNTLKGLKVFSNQQNVVNKFLISFLLFSMMFCYIDIRNMNTMYYILTYCVYVQHSDNTVLPTL